MAPRAERLAERLVTLPLFAGMTDADQDDVVAALIRIQSWAVSRPGWAVEHGEPPAHPGQPT
jgi:hypothetical protein